MENNRFVYVTSIYIYRSNIEQSIHIQSQTHTQTHTHTHTHTQYIQSSHRQTHTSAKFSRKGEGFVSNNGHDRFSTPPPPPPPHLWVVPNNQADSSFLHRVPPVRGGGGGGRGRNDSYQLNQHDDDNKSCNKIGQSIEHEEKYMANKRKLSQFSIWRRDLSMLFLCEQQRTHANGT